MKSNLEALPFRRNQRQASSPLRCRLPARILPGHPLFPGRGGTGHLNRHYEACLKKYSKHEQGGGVQTQLNIAADGSVSTWVYNSDVARQEIARYIAVEDLPIRMGESPAFERMMQRAFCPQYSNVSRKTTQKDIVKSYHEKWDALRQS